ncbi:hypothetical protein THAOC_33878 [Thalassiosira oceanica]|uniref:Uncharacterized protein n=1 Tax=Thalassiosira oceanica TaxID=159749 RepID=K0RL40_THAOC|nr:hypothetical protein THAOC_33878 [Thalassiosira oceanica]|eukprot:EJK47402.1 hypothetical protein THAOC_33878 [Thalassiosira oceanica]
MQPSKTSYQKGNCRHVDKPVDLRNNQIRWDYKRRAAGLDQKYAVCHLKSEVVGDPGTTQMVRLADSRRHWESSTSNVFFGKVNEDASKLITKKLARLTAKTDFGKSMSPLVVRSKPACWAGRAAGGQQGSSSGQQQLAAKPRRAWQVQDQQSPGPTQRVEEVTWFENCAVDSQRGKKPTPYARPILSLGRVRES